MKPMKSLDPLPLPSPPRLQPTAIAILVCIAAMTALAIAMGIGRFAFTPLFPLMVREALIDIEDGALLAASNYLGYFAGALMASRIRLASETLLVAGLIGTALVTAAVGWTSSPYTWITLRFIAGVMSACVLVAATSWGLAWLAALDRRHLSGTIFAGVGLGIAAAGLFCLFAPASGVSSLEIWIQLGLMSAIAACIPLTISRLLPAPAATDNNAAANSPANPASTTWDLGVCYALFGFGYILPATYLPEQARQLVDDPQVFGLAWPLFGVTGALSTIVVAWALKKTKPLRIWAASHLLMGGGVLLSAVWPSLFSIALAALTVGSTFMVITMVGLQEARKRALSNATGVLGQMTAAFALGQLMGPVAVYFIGQFTTHYSTALKSALLASVAGLLLSAFYLARQSRRPHVERSIHE